MAAETLGEIINNYGAVATGISAGLGAIMLLYKKLVRPIIDQIIRWNDGLDKIEHMYQELTPNGGSSLKDSIDRMENSLILSTERFKATNANSHSAMFETDADGNCIWVNRTYCRLTQRTPDQLMGKGWVNAICPAVREVTVGEFEKSVRENREMQGLASEFITPSGDCINIECSTYKMKNHHGVTLGYLGICIPKGQKAKKEFNQAIADPIDTHGPVI